jgi:hypothetical protein
MPPTADGQAFQYTLNVVGRLSEADAFADVIVKTAADGGITRVRDIGRVELGAQTYGQDFRLDGRPAAGLAIFQSPGANALEVGNEVRAKMAALAAEFPQGLTYDIPFDTTKFVKESINEVYKTLYEAAILGARGHPRLPAGLAGHAGARHNGSGHHHRGVCRHGGAGVHGQPLHPVRHRACHRHRG